MPPQIFLCMHVKWLRNFFFCIFINFYNNLFLPKLIYFIFVLKNTHEYLYNDWFKMNIMAMLETEEKVNQWCNLFKEKEMQPRDPF